MPEPAPAPLPHRVGHVHAFLGGGWTLEVVLMPLPDGARPEVEALVSPNGRHAWPRYGRLPAWWHYVHAH